MIAIVTFFPRIHLSITAAGNDHRIDAATFRVAGVGGTDFVVIAVNGRVVTLAGGDVAEVLGADVIIYRVAGVWVCVFVSAAFESLHAT